MFKASVYEITKPIEANDLKEKLENLILPKLYYEFLLLFIEVLGNQLQPYLLGINYKVHMKEGETPTCKLLYSMSRVKLVVLMKCLEKNIPEGIICQSSTPFAAAVLCAKMPDAELSFYGDHNDTSSKTFHNQYSLPSIRETSSFLCKA